jgi:hypothetical protein
MRDGCFVSVMSHSRERFINADAIEQILVRESHFAEGAFEVPVIVLRRSGEEIPVHNYDFNNLCTCVSGGWAPSREWAIPRHIPNSNKSKDESQ